MNSKNPTTNDEVSAVASNSTEVDNPSIAATAEDVYATIARTQVRLEVLETRIAALEEANRIRKLMEEGRKL
jgi:hypothetical protein